MQTCLSYRFDIKIKTTKTFIGQEHKLIQNQVDNCMFIIVFTLIAAKSRREMATNVGKPY